MKTEETTYRESVQNKLDAILAQTTKTNGRVSALEISAHKMDVKLAVMGTAIATMIAVKFPLVASILSSL